MCAHWKKPPDSATFADLNASRRVDPQGSVSFQGGIFDSRIILFDAGLDLNPSIPEADRRQIVHQAVFEAGKTQLTPESVLRRAERLESAFLQRSFKRYVLVTGISLRRYSQRTLRRRVGGTAITFKAFIPKKFDRSPLRNLIKQYVGVPQPLTYSAVLAHIRARSEHEAYKIGIDAIDLVRGIWNLYWNGLQARRRSFERPKPLNRIVLDPIQTLHYSSGGLAVRNVWYDPGYIVALDPLSPSQSEMTKMFAFEERVRRRLLRGNRFPKLGGLASEFVIRYCRSLDDGTLHGAFLKLWALLELMTETKPQEGSDITIRRAVVLFKQSELHKAVLAYIRDQRNRIVHQSEAPDELEELVYRLKMYVEELLHFFVMNSVKFRTRERYMLFLDLPTDVAILKERFTVIRKALRLRSNP
jgi:hypothetical protein